MSDTIELDKLESTIEWLSSVFPSGKFDLKELSPIFGFSLLWNLFERVQCNKLGRKFEAKDLVQIGLNDFDKVSEKILDNAFSHFVGRYVIDKVKGNERLGKLGLQKYGNSVKPFNQTAEDFIKLALNSEQKENKKKMTALLLIIYRFRNNLFHGAKDTVMLNKFAVEFTVINIFLREYLSSKLRPNN